MGFCLFNNVAIAARALQAEDGVGRILIFDWDVHHGNGTQHSFEEDPSVLYASTHQFPYYPGTGDGRRGGRGAGDGRHAEHAAAGRLRRREYLGVLQRVLVPVARAFRPELILVSCGFDAHADDPLASMQLTGAGFRGDDRDRARARRRAAAAAASSSCSRAATRRAACARAPQAVLSVLTRPTAPRLPATVADARAAACSRPWWDAWPRRTRAPSSRGSAPS